MFKLEIVHNGKVFEHVTELAFIIESLSYKILRSSLVVALHHNRLIFGVRSGSKGVSIFGTTFPHASGLHSTKSIIGRTSGW